MLRAGRPVSEAEVNQKLALCALRPQCEDFQEAMVEVLASVLASPKFLYLVRGDPKAQAGNHAVMDLNWRRAWPFFSGAVCRMPNC